MIDPSQPKILGRVGLSVYATSVPGQVIQARPDRGVLAGGLLYVTLGSLSASPSFSFAGPGRVVIVDPATDTVSGMVDLPDQTGCSGIDYRADTNRLYVSCGGEFSDGDQQVARSALVEIDLGGAAPTVGRILRASALGTQPFSYHAPIVVGDTALAVTTGAFDPTTNAMLVPDTAYAAPFDGSAPIKLLDGGAFNLGRPAADAPRTTIFLPDGNAVTPRVRTLDVRAAPWVAGPAAFEPDPVGHLPPREAVGY